MDSHPRSHPPSSHPLRSIQAALGRWGRVGVLALAGLIFFVLSDLIRVAILVAFPAIVLFVL